MNAHRKRRPAATLLLLSVLVAACAGNQALQRAEVEVQRGNLDTAIAYYQQLLLEDPGNTKAKIGLAHVKLEASQQHEKQGVALAEAEQYAAAVNELQLAIRLDPSNQMAIRELGRIEGLLAEQRRVEAGEMTATEMAMEQAATVDSVVPQLQPAVSGPIDFDFRDVAVTEVYRTLAEIGGLNVIFEPTLTEVTTSFQVKDTDFHDALRLLTASHGHFVKVLSPNTFMVVPDDVTKRREYADQIMRTFYLSNADVTTVETQIRTILNTSLIATNPDLNTITVRETPDAMKVIERIVSSADKSVGEILLEVEVLEVSSEVVSNYGLALQPFGGQAQVYPQLVDEGSGELIGRSLNSLGSLTSADVFVTIPSLFYQFLRTTNDFKLVAQPKLRATEGQTTQLLIGEKVPVVTTTFNPQSTIGGNVVPISGTEYQDTGIVLSVLPRVHFNGEITLEITIEVSAVTATATIASVGDLPVFTIRQVMGSVRLRDGETNVIAGLLQDNDLRQRSGIIGLDNVPGLGDALSDTEDTRDQNDIVISITPHLLRAAEITAEDTSPIYVGTQNTVSSASFRGAAGGGVSGVRGPGNVAAGAGPGEDTAPAQPALMSLLPANHVVQVDEEFAIDVTIDSDEEMGSTGFELRFDPAVVAYVDYFEGGFFDRDGAETTVQVSSAGPGSLRVGMARMGTDVGVSGSGSLVTLVFRGVGEGTTPIEIASAALRQMRSGPIAVQMIPAQVQVRPRNPNR